MSLFDSLSTERKVVVLNQTKEGLISELVPMLLRNGIDPSLVNTASPEDAIDGLNLTDEVRIYKICEGLEIIAAKLAALV